MSFGTREMSPIVSTTDAQDDDFVAPGSIGDAKGRTGKRSRRAGSIGSKGRPNSHPWDDSESELIMTLRASGVSYNEATKVNYPEWSYIGLRAKYLRLLELPRWKGRLEQLKEMDEFGQLQAVCEAQLAVAHSRLNRTKERPNTEQQKNGKGPVTANEGEFAATARIMSDTTLAKTANDEADNFDIDENTPLQKPGSKRRDVWSGKDVVKDKEKAIPPATEEQTTTEDKPANVNDLKYENLNKSDVPASNSALDKTILEACETLEARRANSARKIDVIVINSSDDDSSDDQLPLAESLRRAREKRKASATKSCKELK